MRQFLENILISRTADEVTNFFLWVLLLAFLGAFWATWQKKWEVATANAPTMLTTAGVLGTFAGIAIGLVNFRADPESLQTSVSDLLGGLTTAFLTSLVGMGFGLLLKLIRLYRGAQSDETPDTEVGPEDVLRVLEKHTDLLRQSRDAIAGTEESSLAGQLKLMRTDLGDHRRESLAILHEHTALLRDTRDAIAGTEESSLAGQLKLLRTDLGDQHREFSRELWTHLTQFGELLARSATEQVIEALKQVIVEFNEKLTEQFGDNFKALDASVKKLVDWQDRYRAQLERLHHLYEESVRSIGSVETSMRAIEEHSAAIPPTMDQLGTLIETAHHQMSELERHLQAFVMMRDKAIRAVPQTQESIDRIIESIRASMDQVASSHEDLVEQAGKRHTELMGQVEKVQDAMASGLHSAQEAMARAQERHSAKTAEMLETVSNSADALQANATEARRASDAHLRAMEMALTQAQRAMQNQVAEGLVKTQEMLDSAQRRQAEQFATMLNGLKKSASGLVESAVAIRRDVKASQDEHHRRSAEIVAAFRAAGERVVRESGEMNRQLGESAKQMRSNLEAMMRDVTQSQGRAAQQTVAALANEMGDMVKKTRSAIEQQQRDMNRMMMKEIEGVINEMGKALGQIAGRFAKDYRELSTRTAAALRSLEDARRSRRPF